ncbi:peptidoglycan-binding protein ArfA [Umezawaea tangerina]|uniref:Peptidoglycan-binding protein ArfA n=1 Tax=Umezawaea tangerina TaxID=84725 RepID=A0A2T0T4Z9_9PSEU|nr:peptidoglycan-binding protein ArfA [Umezawaea tangerina]
MPALLAATGVLVQGHRIERDLGDRVAHAIDESGNADGAVSVDGRRVTVSGVVPRESARVQALVAAVPGVTAVTVHDAEPGQLLLLVRANEIVLAGTPADAAERSALVEAVTARAGDHRVTDVLAPKAGQRLPVAPAVAASIAGAVVDNGVHDFTGVVQGGVLTARATVVDEQRATTFGGVLTGAAGNLRVAPAIEVGPSIQDSALDLPALGDSINRLVGGNGSIRFQPDTTTWQGHGPVLVQRVARMLLVAPRATITVRGHASAAAADARGLAETRARMVRDVVLGQGVNPAMVETAVSLDDAPESTDTSRQVDILVR